MSVNKAILVGRLGADPELRFTPSGRAVAQFNRATDRSFKDKSGQLQKNTEWHRIVVWDKQAETVSKFLTKGRECYVEGEIRNRSYDDKDGIKRYVTEIVAQRVQFLGGAGGGGGGGRAGGREAEGSVVSDSAGGGFPADDVGDDDIPF